MGRGIFCFCSVDNETNWEKKMNFYRENGVGNLMLVIRRVSFCKSLPYHGSFLFRSSNSAIVSVMESSPKLRSHEILSQFVKRIMNWGEWSTVLSRRPGFDLNPYHVWIFSEQIGTRACFITVIRFLPVNLNPQLLRICSSINELSRF